MSAVLIIVAVIVVTIASILCLSLVTGMGLFISNKSSDKSKTTSASKSAGGSSGGPTSAASGSPTTGAVGGAGSTTAGGGSTVSTPATTRTPVTNTPVAIAGGANIDLKNTNTATSSISVVPVSDRQLLGSFADIWAKCTAPNYVPKEERLENASKVMYASNIRLGYNLPLPTYEQSKMTKQLTESNIKPLLCTLNEMHARMCKDLGTQQCNSSKPVNMFIMGNGADNDKTPFTSTSAAALGGASRLIWSPSAVGGTELGVLSLAAHELTHVIAAHAADPKWGAGIAEGLANFVSEYYLPGGTGAYWTPGFYYANDKQYRYMNPYNTEAMDYRAAVKRAYNSSFWWFMHGRYGGIEAIKNFFQKQVVKSMTLQNVPFWKGMAQHLGVSVNALAAFWLGDLLTLAWFRKDAVRYSLAKKYVNKDVISREVLVFKQFDNGSLTKSVTNSGKAFTGQVTKFKLEAFGFAAYDLNAICFSDMKLQAGAKISVRVTSLPSAADDADTWVMALVTGPESVQYITGNTVTVGPIPSTKPFVLGVMHTKLNLMSGNSAGSSAINHQIEVTSAA